MNPKSWELYAINSFLVEAAQDDPEDSLNYAMTRRELTLVLFGVMLVGRLFPELSEHAGALYRKVTELSDAQDFLDVDNEMRRNVGLPPKEPDA